MPLILGTTANGIIYPIRVSTDGKIQIDSLPAGTANIGDVDVLTLPSLPAGTNNIGDVDVLTLPSLPAGTNNIGDVDVLTLPALPAGTNEIGQIQARNYGYISGAFQKDAIRFGVSGGVFRNFYETTLAPGTNVVTDSAVPTGEIWVVTNFGCLYLGTAPAGVRFQIYHAAAYAIFDYLSPVAGDLYSRQGWWVLLPGDYLMGTIYGATVNDDIYFLATGFKIDIDL